MPEDLLSYAISILLGGGLFKGADALYRSITGAKEKRALAANVGARTPAEIESVSVATMATALESAGKRIKALEDERIADRTFYQSRIDELETERTTDREAAQKRIVELTDQLATVRETLTNVEKQLRELQLTTERKEGGS